MKKLVLMMIGLFLLNAAYAQDKEALKAQKEAQKEAEKVIKKAKNTYEYSMPNPQYGRKETDFEKLAEAVPLIQSAIENQYTKNDPQTWKVAADIQYAYYQKQENELKAEPDNEQLKQTLLESSTKIVEYCIKYDSLLRLEPKVKPEEFKAEHDKYQKMAVNPCIQLLQEAQPYSNSDKPEELQKAIQYTNLFLRAMEGDLMKDFKHKDLSDWKTFAKAFRAQAYLNIPGTPEESIVSAYQELMNTRFKGNAYQSLVNYFKEKDDAKYQQYLQAAIDGLKDDAEQKELRGNFAIMLMQHQFQNGNKDGFKKTAQLIKDEFSDNSNAINAYLMEGQMAFEEKDYDRAKAIFLEAREKFPDEPKGLLMAARSAWMKAQAGGSKRPDMDEAIRLFKQLEAENADDSELWGEALYILYNNTQQPTLAAPYKKYYKAN